MIYRSTVQQIKEYYENSAMNQSLLKTLMKGPAAFIAAQKEPESKLYYEEKGHFVIGSAVDCYLTQGEEVFKSLYHTTEASLKKPGEKIMSVLKMAFDKYQEKFVGQKIDIVSMSSDDWFNILHISSDMNEYYMNRHKDDWKVDTRKETIYKDPNTLVYLQSLIDAQGKQILDEEETNIVNGIVMSLTTHPYVKDYFTPVNDNVDIYFQLPIYFTYRFEVPSVENDHIFIKCEEECKGLLDEVIVDHEAKTIQPADVKTLNDEPYKAFFSNLKSYEYQIQAAYYTYAVGQWKNNTKQLHEIYPEIKDISNYTILPFKFIVETTNIALQGQPLIFICREDLIEQGFNGRNEMKMPLFIPNTVYYDVPDDYITYKEIKGINQLFNDLFYYRENGFNKRKEIKEGNLFEIDYRGIYPIELIPIN